MQETKKPTLLQKLSNISFLSTIGILPIVFAPFVSNNVMKFSLFAFGIFLCALFWLFARLVDGKVVIAKSPIIFLLWSLPLVAGISAFFSESPISALFGRGFEVDTTISILLFALIALFSISYFEIKERIIHAYVFILGGGIVVGIVQIIRMVFSKTIGTSIVWGDTPTIVGSWNDLAVFFGMIIILALVYLEFFVVTKPLRIAMYALLAFAGIVLASVNFLPVWIFVGVLALFIFIFKISFFDRLHTEEESKKQRTIPLFIFVSIIVSLVFVLANAQIGSILGNVFKIQSFEIRPSVFATWEIFKSSVVHDPILGVGPNHFFSAWNLYKPASVLTSDFWNVSFNNGFGYLPSIFVTQGILGGLLWVLFLGWYLFKGFAFIFKGYSDLKKNDFFFSFSSFILSVYCIGMFVVYSPHVLIFIFGFMFMGMFISTLVQFGFIKKNTFDFLQDPRMSFFSILILVGCVVGVMMLGFRSVKVFWANILYGSSSQSNSLEKAEQRLVRAITLAPNDAMYRALSGVYLQKLGTYLNQKNVSVQSIQPELQSLLDSAQLAGKRAVSFDKLASQNWTNLASIYQAIIPLKITGAYDQSKSAYTQAQKLSPKNPDITLQRAGLEIVNQDSQKARTLALEAVAQKKNFVDGYIFLAQLESSLGNSTKAIEYATSGAQNATTSAKAFYWKGIMEFNASQYTNASVSFERAVILNPLFDTGRFMLARTYDKIGKSPQALEQIKILKKRFPDNTTIKKALQNLEQGQSIDLGISTDNSLSQNTNSENQTPLVSGTSQKNITKTQ